jgi:hypothetical protein
VEALVEVDLLRPTGLADELQKVAVGPGGCDDVTATLAEVDAEDGGDLRVALLFVFLTH